MGFSELAKAIAILVASNFTKRNIYLGVAALLSLCVTAVYTIIFRICIIDEISWFTYLAVLPGIIIWLVAVNSVGPGEIKIKYLPVGILSRLPPFFSTRAKLILDFHYRVMVRQLRYRH